MNISDIIRNSVKPFPSIEIVPPLKGISKDELLSSIEPLLEYAPKYINVTCHRNEFEFIPNADGTFLRRMVRSRVNEVAVAAAIMSHYQVEVVPHVICAGVSTDQIHATLDDLNFLGIRNVMALRGDCLSSEKRFTPDPHGYAHADELVRGIREYRKEEGDVFCIGVGGYPEKHFESPNIETDVRYLKQKVDAGADFIITQMFFDNERFYAFERLCRQAGITVPIIPGLKPLSTKRQVTLLPEAFSLDIPFELSSAVIEAKTPAEIYQIGQDWCTKQCRDLLQHGVKAIHFYTMGQARNVCEILRNCF